MALLRLTILAGLLALVLAAPAAACDAARHAEASRAAGGAHPPLAIGDSVLLGAVPQVARRGVEVDARGCRTMAQGIATLRARRAARDLPPVVALALGTNGTVSRAELGAAMRILGPRRVLALVTPRALGGGTDPDAAPMRRAARRHPDRVRLIDWAGRTAGRTAWFAPDGIHLTHAGARGMARILAELPAIDAERRRAAGGSPAG